MNINDYRRAMDRIIPDQELKERIMNGAKPQKRYIPARRVLNGLLAAALALACLFTVALAASPELRTAVLSFFHMEEREQVPSGSGTISEPDISQAEIGELVKAQYIRLDSFRYGYSGGGLLNELTWSEDYRTLETAKFWEIKDNELVPVEIDMKAAKVDITFNGNSYQGNLYWFIWGGELAVFQSSPTGIDTRPDEQWYVNTLPGRTDTVMLRLYEGRQMDYSEYPILYHLDTGEVEDILAGTGVDALEYAYDYSWSENFRRAIILCSSEPYDQQTWFCDLDTKTLARLEDLTGIEAAYASFADNDTLILSTYSEDEDGVWQDVTCWAYDISTGQAVKTLDHAPYSPRWEMQSYGTRVYGSRCISVTEKGQVQIIDLRTGDQTVIEGFTFQTGDNFMPNTSGNKLLYYSADPGLDGLGISQMGVVDLEKGVFFAFDREGYENLHEESIGWEDDNTVGIGARTQDYETRYLIMYQF